MNIKPNKKTQKKNITRSPSKKSKEPVKKIADTGKKHPEVLNLNKKVANSAKKHVEEEIGSDKKHVHHGQKHVKTVISSNKKIADSGKKPVERIISSDKKNAGSGKEHIKVAIGGDKKVVGSDKKHAEKAISSNKEIVELIEVQLDEEAKAIADIVEEAFAQSSVTEFTEETLDSGAKIYSGQIDVDFNERLVDLLEDSGNGYPERVLELIRENFEASHKLKLDIAKEIMELYNKHTNRVVNFNQKIGERINFLIESFY